MPSVHAQRRTPRPPACFTAQIGDEALDPRLLTRCVTPEQAAKVAAQRAEAGEIVTVTSPLGGKTKWTVVRRPGGNIPWRRYAEGR